jgi:protocatechuate 3,4-dioxygenase alpha subunit
MKPTPSQTIGPFFGFAMEDESPGGPLRVSGRVLDGDGVPVNDAMLELWDGQHFARALTNDDGRWSAVTQRPTGPYIAVSVFARGLLQRLVTRIYFEPAAALHPTLIAREEQDGWEWDIHLQGDRETVFFAL